MRAMVLGAAGEPLRSRDFPEPVAGPGEVLIRVRACAVCRTDLHIVDGELPEPKLPLILGHQIAGIVETVGDGVEGLAVGDRVGVPWLGWTDGTCDACRAGRENLCPAARFTGYGIDGGFAELTVADARFCLPLPDGRDDLAAAPLLCAGPIGLRALRLAGDPASVGMYGFGNAARLLTQVARAEGRRVFAFTRPGDVATQRLAVELGAEWAGDSTERPPEPLEAAILFAAVGDLVPFALAAVGPGGAVVCAEIHMSDIPSFAYDLLWGERVLRSVANLTRRDGLEFLEIAARIGIAVRTTTFGLDRANDALAAARTGSPATPVVTTR
jgi:alcohol dehydrogenase, propanol-preferring